ncbi:TIGR03364 family FAD-dependent oxidoreductase [Sphingobacterium oryzagri]|uniref:TIGR03364 family FAD-dependent oxidoreductase n=1 Tax=Sphingobacterium oryzagri TaxID=3025669 RepID=A0ABY7WD85_9SPHI|nr:TIGR03364 family FAD-dependent oxidoreductase [Sphingobacterium sp. KACC 22765]WDF67457.1 TIGR03364 family FAD-dependent oxidoreductase [Sphingobacterium sp. KACC 22765]
MQHKKYDLIVVGGGILGTFHAYHALTNGLEVLHLEKDNFPVGSTVRNFGQVVPSGMEGDWFSYGVRGLEIYQSIQQEFDISVRQNGSFYIASDDEETQIIHELAAHYDSLGYDHALWSKTQIRERFPLIRDTYPTEAIVFPQELSVEPENMIRRLHTYLKQRFSTYHLEYNCTALHCESTSSHVTVSCTNQQRFEAEKVIICNGYEFKLLFRELFEDSGLEISKLQMLRSKPLPDMKLPGNILTGLTIRRYESFEAYCPSFRSMTIPAHYEELKKWGIHILFKQAVDGSIIIGDSHEYALGTQFEELGFSINDHINKLMLEEANRIIPIQHDQIATSWAGFYAQHKNHIVEHDVDDRIHIRTGIGGKGMTASAGYAEQSINKIYNN